MKTKVMEVEEVAEYVPPDILRLAQHAAPLAELRSVWQSSDKYCDDSIAQPPYLTVRASISEISAETVSMLSAFISCSAC